MIRRALIAAGTLIMAYAVGGALFDDDVSRIGVAVFLAAVIVLHDAVFQPVILGVGALTRRVVPAGGRPAVQAAGLISVAVSVVALPFVLGFGRRPDNPSALPLPYGRGLLLILIVVWVVALGVAVMRRKGSERRRRHHDG
jgi:hypothetical protein